MGLALARSSEDDGFEEAAEQFGAVTEFLRSMEAGKMTESDFERRVE